MSISGKLENFDPKSGRESRDYCVVARGGSGKIIDFPGLENRQHYGHFLAKQVIYHERESANCIYMVRRGLVKQLSYLPNGRARITRLKGKGDMIGLEGMLDQPHLYTAIAVGEVWLDCYLTSYLQRLSREHNDMSDILMKHWYSDLEQADRWILDFSTGGIKPRIARLVKFLAEKTYGNSASRVELLTVSEMADMLGVTPESVSRTLAEFKRNGLLHRVDNEQGEIYRIDPVQLRRESYG